MINWIPLISFIGDRYLVKYTHCIWTRVFFFPCAWTSLWFLYQSFGGLGDYFTLSTALFNWPEIAQATSFAGRPILDFLVALFATTLLEIPSYPIYLLSSSEKDQHHPLLEESAAEEDGDIEGQHVYKKTCMAFLKHPVTLYVALMTIIYTYGGARTNISTGSFYQVTYPKYIPKNQPVGCVVGGGSALPELFTDYDFWFNKSTKLVNVSIFRPFPIKQRNEPQLTFIMLLL